MELNINKIIIFILILIINIILNLIDKSYFDINVEINNKNNYLITHNISFNTQYINSSRDYWEHRYKIGGNSGVGSYNNLADFKAKVINNFIINKNIKTVIEWGSGDCNQLALANYKNYIGYDVSKTAIDICKKKFNNDKTKTFIFTDKNFNNNKKADLSISLDVIYHLVEDNVFSSYMNNLFKSSNRYVCIYSSNVDKGWAQHVRHRKFSEWIDKYISNNWKLIKFIPNKYPYDPLNTHNTSFSDFYFYEKMN